MRTGNKERMGRILEMHANDREDVDAVYAGDIMAAIGIKDVRTGDSLVAIDNPVILEEMTFPDPVIDVAVEPKSKQIRRNYPKHLWRYRKRIRLSEYKQTRNSSDHSLRNG